MNEFETVNNPEAALEIIKEYSNKSGFKGGVRGAFGVVISLNPNNSDRYPFLAVTPAGFNSGDLGYEQAKMVNNHLNFRGCTQQLMEKVMEFVG